MTARRVSSSLELNYKEMGKLSIIVLSLALLSSVSGKLNVLLEWKYIDYVWKNPMQKQESIDSGSYNASQIFTIDVDRSRDGRLFVTTPRQRGVPATLSTVSDKIGNGGPLLKPYPSWYWNQRKDCRGITSVYRVAIDVCNRLWVLDTGIDGTTQTCPAQLLVFDLSNDRLIKRITIPPNISRNKNGTAGLLITPVVETSSEDCSRQMVYMADVEGFGLAVWDGHRLRRYEDPSFEADANHANFTISGQSFQLNDGLFSLALQPPPRYGHSTRLFYRPLASLKQSFVSTEYFHRSSRPFYKTLDYTFPAQVSIQAFSPGGILFMGYTNPPAIACWNSYKPMTNENVVIVAQDEVTLQFTSGMKIVKGRELLVFTNRFQKIITGTQNFSEVNFRILIESNLHDLVKNTACHP